MSDRNSKPAGSEINNIKKSYNNGVKVLPTKSTERPNPQPNNPNTGQEKKWVMGIFMI